MKRNFILKALMALIILVCFGIGALIVRDFNRTPMDYFWLAKDQITAHNYPRALKYMTQAADGGFARAQYELALLYDAGDKVPENREKALQYMSLALAADMPEAHYVTAVWGERGYFGEPNMEQIIGHYEAAARAGMINAMKSLVVLYGEGVGRFPDNLKRRAYWMEQLKHK